MRRLAIQTRSRGIVACETSAKTRTSPSNASRRLVTEKILGRSRHRALALDARPPPVAAEADRPAACHRRRERVAVDDGVRVLGQLLDLRSLLPHAHRRAVLEELQLAPPDATSRVSMRPCRNKPGSSSRGSAGPVSGGAKACNMASSGRGGRTGSSRRLAPAGDERQGHGLGRGPDHRPIAGGDREAQPMAGGEAMGDVVEVDA